VTGRIGTRARPADRLRSVTMLGVNDPVRPEDLRVSDVERAAVQERLRTAVGAGQLDFSEFDARLATVWQARTRGELMRVTAGLPAVPAARPAPPPPPRRRVFADDGGGTAMRVLSIIWLCAFSINVVVWFLVSVTTGFTYPWPIWMLPSGAVLATLYAIGVGRPRP
jgi:hypothetical protein